MAVTGQAIFESPIGPRTASFVSWWTAPPAMTTFNQQIDLRDYMCPYCHADIGEYCVTASGKKAGYPHAGRWEVGNGYRASVYLIHEEP